MSYSDKTDFRDNWPAGYRSVRQEINAAIDALGDSFPPWGPPAGHMSGPKLAADEPAREDGWTEGRSRSAESPPSAADAPASRAQAAVIITLLKEINARLAKAFP